MTLPSVKLKNEVKINGAHFYPEVQTIIQTARETAPELIDKTVWITSANDSQHKQGSLHYKNRAFDIRIWNIKADTSSKRHALARRWVVDMNNRLGRDYDVLLEADHIHGEFDPKEV